MKQMNKKGAGFENNIFHQKHISNYLPLFTEIVNIYPYIISLSDLILSATFNIIISFLHFRKKV